MARPKFSVVTSIHCWNDYRKNGIKRAAKSLENQTYKDFEWIVVNDGSPEEFEVPSWAKVINKDHEERVAGLNAGFKQAQGEIFCTLDSDDEYETNYLEKVEGYFNKYPKYKMFNFGCTYIHGDGGVNKRAPFTPKKLKVGHEIFGGGNIVSGTFVWHRSVYDDLGAFPDTHLTNVDCSELNYPSNYGHTDEEPQYVRDLFMGTPYDVAAWFQLEFPEQRQFFMVDHENEPNKVIKEIGNPWGQDHIIFYKYTRKYWSKPMNDYLYIVHWKQGVE